MTKPGDPYYALYTREVLPDEIDEDHVETQANRRALSSARPWEPCSDNVGIRAKEPAPDGGLIERLGRVALHAWVHTPGSDWSAVARAVLAEIAKGRDETLWQWFEFERLSSQKRVAELEAELAELSEPRNNALGEALLRGEIQRLASDLATVTRERDEWVSCARAVGLTGGPGSMQQAAHMADAACEAIGSSRDDTSPRDIMAAFGRLEREREDAVFVASEMQKERDSLTRELAEEQRKVRSSDANYVAACERAGRAEVELSEARADYDRERKLLVEQARETERKEAEAREALDITGRGLEHIADALDAHRAKTSGESVVRVEPEKAEALGIPSPEVRRAVEQFHASGERSGQVAEQARKQRESCLEPADDGPPRVGDVVRIEEVQPWSVEAGNRREGSTRVVRHCSPGVSNGFYVITFGDGLECECKVTILRRAGQPEAKAEETPVTGGPGPHAGAVAALVEWAEEVSRYSPTGWPDFNKIRAERAGRRG